MRKILFRGKRNDKGNWIYGYYVFQKKRNGCFGQTIADRDFDRHYVITPRGESFEVIPETVGQYTGLIDKNGTKIFEGDILVDEGDKVVSVVEFRNGMFCLVDYEIIDAAGDFDEYDCQPMDNYYIDEMKIDGSIHDNPELLKGREKE